MIAVKPGAASRTPKIPVDLPETLCRESSRIFSFARCGLGAILLAAPLAFGAVQPWAWAALVIAAFGLLLLWAIGNIQTGTLRIQWSPLYLPASLFLALGVAQLFSGITLDSYATREAILKLVAVLIFFFIAGHVFVNAPKTLWMTTGLAVTLYAFALGLFAILQFFSGHNLIYWSVKSEGWTFGPYVNHNHYAGLMEMLIPISASYVLSRPRRDPRRLLLTFGLCVPVASLLLSGSRGGFISLLVEAVVFGWIILRKHPVKDSGAFVVMMAIGLTAASLLFFWMAPARVVSRLAGLANPARTSEVTFGQRKRAALDSLHIFRDHPWVGIGLGSFDTVFPRYRTFPTDLGWAHAHNDYAEALAETGVAGGSLIAFALVIFLRFAFRDLDRRLRHEAGWIQLGAALGCCGLLTHSFADFNLRIPANAVWFGVCVALAMATGSVRRGRARQQFLRGEEKILHAVP